MNGVHFSEPARELLAAPFKEAGSVERIGPALWLYVWLALKTNASGHICRTLDSLAKDLDVSHDQVKVWLARLVHVGLVSVQVPAPYLVIKLKFWSGVEQQSTVSSEQNSASHKEVPVSSSKLQLAAAEQKNKQASSREDGGAGEGGELLAEVLRVLGETDPTDFRELVEKHPHPIVLKALLRVKTTPPEQIRKSKAALFRFLVNKFSQESHDRHPSH